MRKAPNVFIQKVIIPNKRVHLKKKLLHLSFEVLKEGQRKKEAYLRPCQTLCCKNT